MRRPDQPLGQAEDHRAPVGRAPHRQQRLGRQRLGQRQQTRGAGMAGGAVGVVQIALAYALVSAGLRHVTALEGMLLLLLEPALNPVWAWIVHGENPGPWSLGGGAIVLAATVFNAVRPTRD